MPEATITMAKSGVVAAKNSAQTAAPTWSAHRKKSRRNVKNAPTQRHSSGRIR